MPVGYLHVPFVGTAKNINTKDKNLLHFLSKLKAIPWLMVNIIRIRTPKVMSQILLLDKPACTRKICWDWRKVKKSFQQTWSSYTGYCPQTHYKFIAACSGLSNSSRALRSQHGATLWLAELLNGQSMLFGFRVLNCSGLHDWMLCNTALTHRHERPSM